MTETITQAGAGYRQPPRRVARQRTDPKCTAAYHCGVFAYGKGCTCPESIAAYQAKLDRLKTVPAAVDENGQCIAEDHDTWGAYIHSGCRHPAALDAHENRLETQRRYWERKRAAMPASQRRIRMPRSGDWQLRWRGPDTRVSRISVSLAMAGFPAGCTRHELMLAAIQLSRTGNRYESGLLGLDEIAERLQVNRQKVQYLLTLPASLAESRTRRRLADVRARSVLKHGWLTRA